MPARVYNERLAREILISLAQKHPEPIFNWADLRQNVKLMQTTTFDEWRLTLERLEQEHKVETDRRFDAPMGFVNLRITQLGLQNVEEVLGINETRSHGPDDH